MAGDIINVDECSKLFRCALNSLVHFVTDLATQSEDTLIANFVDLEVSQDHLSPRVATCRIHTNLFLPLVGRLDAVHSALFRVEQAVAAQSPSHSLDGQKRQAKPTPPPTIMSITHLRGVYTAIEILWLWGVEAALAAGGLVTAASQNFTQASHPKSLLLSAPCMRAVFKAILSSLSPQVVLQDSSTIWSLVTAIDHTVRHLSFRGMMLQRNLPRVVLACIALDPSLPPLPALSVSAQGELSAGRGAPWHCPEDLLREVQSDGRAGGGMELFVRALQQSSRVGGRQVQRGAARRLTSTLLSKVRCR